MAYDENDDKIQDVESDVQNLPTKIAEFRENAIRAIETDI